jgi:hypothetical protein
MILGGVAVDYMTKNQRVEKRKDLIGRGQQKSGHKQFPVLPGIVVKKIHRRRSAMARAMPFRWQLRVFDS